MQRRTFRGGAQVGAASAGRGSVWQRGYGDVVKQAPTLCRMTSSVFGGIAARNNDGPVTVVLEERIAVGDPGCRVVVHLQPDPDAPDTFGHRYSPPER